MGIMALPLPRRAAAACSCRYASTGGRGRGGGRGVGADRAPNEGVDRVCEVILLDLRREIGHIEHDNARTGGSLHGADEGTDAAFAQDRWLKAYGGCLRRR